jgi:hypothetical protein
MEETGVWNATWGLTRCKELENKEECTAKITSLVKNTNHQQMHKQSFIINRNTLLLVSTLLGHLQGELFCYRYTKVALYG